MYHQTITINIMTRPQFIIAYGKALEQYEADGQSQDNHIEFHYDENTYNSFKGNPTAATDFFLECLQNEEYLFIHKITSLPF